MGVGILAKRVVLELGSSTNFVYSLYGLPEAVHEQSQRVAAGRYPSFTPSGISLSSITAIDSSV